MTASNIETIAGTEELWLLKDRQWYVAREGRWLPCAPRPEVVTAHRTSGSEVIAYRQAWDSIRHCRRVDTYVPDVNPYRTRTAQAQVATQEATQVLQPVIVFADNGYSQPQQSQRYFVTRRTVTEERTSPPVAHQISQPWGFGQWLGAALLASAVGSAAATTVKLLKGK